MRARVVVEVARKVAEKKSLPRGLVEAALQGTRQASAAWEQAVANVPAGAAQLAAAMEAAHAAGGPVSVLCFSLGCRVVLYAIEAGVLAPGAVENIVFVGSAAPASAFAPVASVMEGGASLVHVFSRRDAVLDRLYPLGEGSVLPSGRAALSIEGVKNVEVDVGHRGYASIADRLWALTTGDEEAAATRRLPSR